MNPTNNLLTKLQTPLINNTTESMVTAKLLFLLVKQEKAVERVTRAYTDWVG